MEKPEIINAMDTNISESHLITACQDHKLRTYTISNTTLVPDQIIEAHDAPLTQCIFIDNFTIASSCIKGVLKIFKLENKFVEKFSRTFETAIKVLKSDGATLYVGLSNGKLFRVGQSLCEDELVLTFESPLVGFDVSNNYAIGCCEDGSVHCMKDGKITESYNDNAKDVAVFNAFEIVRYVSVGEKIVIYAEKRQEIENEGESVKFGRAGFCFVVGCGDGFRCYGPDSDGNFVEVEVEKIE